MSTFKSPSISPVSTTDHVVAEAIQAAARREVDAALKALEEASPEIQPVDDSLLRRFLELEERLDAGPLTPHD